jgi:hypothetical protein
LCTVFKLKQVKSVVFLVFLEFPHRPILRTYPSISWAETILVVFAGFCDDVSTNVHEEQKTKKTAKVARSSRIGGYVHTYMAPPPPKAAQVHPGANQ